MKEIHLKVEEHLSEESLSILNTLKDNKVVLINAPMKVGKTTFVVKNLNNYCMEKFQKLIFVIPTIAQIEQLYQRYKIPTQYTFGNASKSDGFIITTPDSLPKIIKQCEEMNIKFILAVDEAHEEESSYNFRSSFKNIKKSMEHKLCTNIIKMSATPDNIILSQKNNYDCIINIETKNKFINAKKFEIVEIDKHDNIQSIATYLKNISKHYNQIIFKIDDIKKLDSINKLLENVAILKEDEKTIYLSSKNREDNIINQNIVDDVHIPKEFKFIGFTSLANSGIEILTQHNVAVVNFSTRTFNFINEIQFIGRFRNGVKSYYMAIETPKEKQQLLSYETMKELINKLAINDLDYLNKRYEKYNFLYSIDENKSELRNEYPFILFDSILNKYYIDEILLNDFIFKNYIKQFLNHPKNLLNKFKDHKTFIAEKYIISKFKEENKEISKICKEIKKSKEALKKEEQDLLKESLKYLNSLSDKELSRMLTDSWDKEFLPVTLKKHLDVWEELGEDKRKLIQDLKRYIPKLNDVQAFRIAITTSKKDIENIFDSYKAIKLNKIYDINPNDLIRKRKTSLEMKLKVTRDFMRYKGYEKHGQRITSKLLNELFEYYIDIGILNKEKKFTKTLEKTLINLLKIIYKCTLRQDDKQLIISSVRKNIDDLINVTSIN